VADRGPVSRRLTVHRFFLPPGSIQGDAVSIPPATSRQIRSVLRLRPGDRIIVLDNSGREFAVRLLSPSEGVVEERHHNTAEPATQLVLYQGMLKGQKMDFVLQKGTEIGIARFVPIVTERSVAGEPGEARQHRYRTIVQEAAEQSGRGHIPQVSPPMPLRQALTRAEGMLVIPWEQEREARLASISASPGETISLFIGPEGGFSPAEIEAAAAAGARVVSLGPRILRAETAALISASLLLATAGDLG
jgi:16S rRNA (uracil1498-N3)-methyltransferase